jgi:hypothetical protein
MVIFLFSLNLIIDENRIFSIERNPQRPRASNIVYP